MSQASSSSEEFESEVKEGADYGAPGDRIGHHDHEVDGENKIGLAELCAMGNAYRALESLSKDGQNRAFKWLAEALDVQAFQQRLQAVEPTPPSMQHPTAAPVGGGSQTTPREFISQKRPESLVERVACLAFYLVRYRGINHFRTADIVALNTEAAAHRFGNPSRDVDNADRHNGYLVSAGNGKKQLTVRGEAVVEALPDRESVRAALKEHPHKPRRSSGTTKKTPTQTTDNLE